MTNKNFFEINNVDFNVSGKTKVKNVSFSIMYLFRNDYAAGIKVSPELIDEYSKLKLIYFIRVSFIFVVTVLPIILFFI